MIKVEHYPCGVGTRIEESWRRRGFLVSSSKGTNVRYRILDMNAAT